MEYKKKILDNIIISNDVRIEHMKFNAKSDIGKSFQMDGYCLALCTKGSFKIEISLQKREVTKGTLIVYTPGNVLNLSGSPCGYDEDIELLTMITSKQFTTGIQLNVNRIYSNHSKNSDFPCIRLNERESALLERYFILMQDVAKLGIEHTHSQMSLCSSIFYLLESILDKENPGRNSVGARNMEGQKVRAKEIFEEFMKLVSEYHSKEKGLAFYAAKLCISPKYLSKLVKTASGRTAPEWIDSFVILQAKNLLQYSSMNIKEIAFNLNFKSLPAFYKFFKSKTGLTPMEFKLK